jgi:hypothetical protein
MNSKHLRLTVFTFLLLVYGFCDSHYLLAQTPDTQSGPASQNTKVLQPLPDRTGTGWNSAHNRWQLTAVDLQSQVDTVSPIVRTQRNRYWQPTLEIAYKQANGSTTMAVGGGSGSYGPAPEFPDVEGSVWAIGTFESVHVYATDSDYHLLYTEMTIELENVFRAPEYLNLSAGILIDCAVSGGRVKLPNGIINSLQLSPNKHFPQPGHKYLFLLRHIDQGNFFIINKSWDISSGIVRPEDPREEDRAARGASTINGMSVNDLINYLPTVLPIEPKK